MYYILFGFLYVLSLIPWRVMYFISDGIYVILYYLIGYRKKVVMQNLLIAFPEKTHEERVRICKDFYHNFVDTFLEIIKLISINEKQFRKLTTTNVEVINSLKGKVPNVALVSAHFFNWEIGALVASLDVKYQMLSVYMPLGNKAFDKIMLDMRTKFGAIFLPATDFRNHFVKYAGKEYALGLIADQSPGEPGNAYWIPFFGKLTPFVKGPEKSARIYNTAVVFAHYYKVKRGYYQAHFELLTTTPKELPKGTITREYVSFLERCIRQNPSNYLWSHRRWKHEFKEEYRKLVIER